ncbi:MAG: ATP-binding cassette domain-containing protein [Fervidicoccaceae archaeon]
MGINGIEARELSISAKRRKILENINFEASQGELVVISGPTGSGKSTLMKAIGGILYSVYSGFDVSGKISVFGLNPENALKRGFISYAPQDSRSFFIGRNALEELEYHGINWKEISFPEEKLLIPIRNLSAGEQYRLIAEISFAAKKKVIMLDEPSAFLDSETLSRILSIVKEKSREERSIALISDHRVEGSTIGADRKIELGSPQVSCNRPDLSSWMNKKKGGKIALRDFSLKKGNKIIARGIEFEVGEGEIAALLGPNGSGKSSLLREIAIASSRNAKNEVITSGRVFYIAESPLYPFAESTVIGEIRRWKRKNWENGGMEEKILQTFNLHELSQLLPFSLSIGQSRALSIASSILAEPDILIIDEPSLGLDRCLFEAVIEYLESFRSSGGTVLMATHDPRLVSISDRKIYMESFLVR